MRNSDATFVRRMLLALLLVTLVWLFWQLRHVAILAFGAVLFAVILNSAAGALQNRLRFPEKLSLTAAVLIITGTLAAMFVMFGAEVAGQAERISEAMPIALEKARELAGDVGLGGWAEERFTELLDGSALGGSNVGGLLMRLGDGLTNLIVLLVGGIFLAANPDLYKTGLIKLIPPSSREEAATALDDCTAALRLWLKGRLIAMVLVGVLTGTGLWLIGVPSYFALGLLAAVLEFIPLIGPIIAAIPAILLAMLGSPEDALFVALLFLFIQQVEGNLITPIVQQHAVELPPAVLLFSLLALGVLFGLLGVILAEALTVALFVLVKRLYVRDALGTDTPMPGDEKPT